MKGIIILYIILSLVYTIINLRSNSGDIIWHKKRNINLFKTIIACILIGFSFPFGMIVAYTLYCDSQIHIIKNKNKSK